MLKPLAIPSIFIYTSVFGLYQLFVPLTTIQESLSFYSSLSTKEMIFIFVTAVKLLDLFGKSPTFHLELEMFGIQ